MRLLIWTIWCFRSCGKEVNLFKGSQNKKKGIFLPLLSKDFFRQGEYTVAPTYPWFCFLGFSYLLSNTVQNTRKNSRHKKFFSFRLCVTLSSMIKSCSVPLGLTWDMHHSFARVSLLCTLPTYQSFSSYLG